MKILLLSCGTGEGHNSAAKAIAEVALAHGDKVVLRDPLSFKSQKAMRWASGSYNYVLKYHPRIFGLIYHVGALYDKTKWTSPVYRVNASYAQELHRYICEEGFDAVICTHLYALQAMTAIVRKGYRTVPFYGVMTDYTGIPFFRESRPDLFFTAHADLTDELVRKGIPASIQYPTGIPVSPKFALRVGRAAARARLGIPKEKKVYLLMSGGVGCLYLLSLCKQILQRSTGDFAIYALVGNNDRVKKTLEKRFPNEPRLRVISFTEDVAFYMEAADVLVSKSGGLSSTEAAVVRVPLVHLRAVPGCETANAAFFFKRRLSLCAKTVRQAASLACDLVSDPQQSEQMRRRQAAFIAEDSAQQIYRKVVTEQCSGQSLSSEDSSPAV